VGRQIVTGDLVEGERIQELRIANELNVSRGSVREALLILERRHLIEIYPRRGAVVSEMSAQQIQEANNEAKRIVELAKEEGETKKKEKELAGSETLLKAKSEAERTKAESDKYALQQQRKLEEAERQFKQKEGVLTQKLSTVKIQEEEIGKAKEHLDKQLKITTDKQEQLDKAKEQIDKQKATLDEKINEAEKIRAAVETDYLKQLEKAAAMTAEEAKQQLISQMLNKAEADAMAYIKEVIDDAKLKANKEAKKIIIQTIQRTAAEHTIENTVSVFNLESDDVKGQIIGREGRNIRALEAATGVEIIVDDTPIGHQSRSGRRTGSRSGYADSSGSG